MRLLLDGMYAPPVAVALRARDHDVVAVAETPALRELEDRELFAVAQLSNRAVVTENVADFLAIDHDLRAGGHEHGGMVFTTNRQFPRHDRRQIGRLVRALDAWLCAGAPLVGSLHWLE